MIMRFKKGPSDGGYLFGPNMVQVKKEFNEFLTVLETPRPIKRTGMMCIDKARAYMMANRSMSDTSTADTATAAAVEDNFDCTVRLKMMSVIADTSTEMGGKATRVEVVSHDVHGIPLPYNGIALPTV